MRNLLITLIAFVSMFAVSCEQPVDIDQELKGQISMLVPSMVKKESVTNSVARTSSESVVNETTYYELDRIVFKIQGQSELVVMNLQELSSYTTFVGSLELDKGSYMIEKAAVFSVENQEIPLYTLKNPLTFAINCASTTFIKIALFGGELEWTEPYVQGGMDTGFLTGGEIKYKNIQFPVEVLLTNNGDRIIQLADSYTLEVTNGETVVQNRTVDGNSQMRRVVKVPVVTESTVVGIKATLANGQVVERSLNAMEIITMRTLELTTEASIFNGSVVHANQSIGTRSLKDSAVQNLDITLKKDAGYLYVSYNSVPNSNDNPAMWVVYNNTNGRINLVDNKFEKKFNSSYTGSLPCTLTKENGMYLIKIVNGTVSYTLTFTSDMDLSGLFQ